MTKLTIKAVFVIVLIALIGLGIWWVNGYIHRDEERNIRPLKVEDVRAVVRLSTIEIDEEIPVKGHVGKKHLVARQRLTGDVSFDLEQLKVIERSDTVEIVLPPAKITLRESTTPGSYEVIDQWNESLLGKSGMTTAQENELKRKTIEYAKRNIRRKGYPEMARQSAISNIRNLLSSDDHRVLIIR